MASPDPWAQVVNATAGWAQGQVLNLRDVVVLLPFAQLLPVARQAFGAAGGWVPRIETTQSLARGLGPAEAPAAGQISFDVALDRLVARRLLRAQSWAAAWAQRDAQGFEQALAALVDTAHAIARAASAIEPSRRALHWEHARSLLSLQALGPGAPGTRERLLSRVALEWAAAAPVPATDMLFGLRPAGWVALQAGGPDRLTRHLLEHAAGADLPCLWLDADADLSPGADPFAALAPSTCVRFGACDDFEDEAQRSAACVLQHLQAGEQPVALIAQDRSLVRRVRALLGRQGVALRDETGWKLSTTRAGAGVRSLLTCVPGDASTDEWLDWLKACAGPWPSLPGNRRALDELERELRESKRRLASHVDADQLGNSAAALWRQADAALQTLASLGEASGSDWGAALDAALRATGQRATLEADDAGRQVLVALQTVPAAERMDLHAFTTWLDAALEQASFLPESPAAPTVVITPLARAMLRPFAAVVFPGVDERHFGMAGASSGLLSDAECSELGVPNAQTRRDAELLAFVQVLRQPQVTLLHRRADEGEPLAASAWVELLRLSLGRRAGPDAWLAAADLRERQALQPTPTDRPRPRAPGLLPQRLSASACEALRACPYRFFALRLLRLGALEELDGELQKRDYGNWLHRVLQRFHAERGAPMAAEFETARLHQIGLEVLQEHRLDEAEFLPYSASFARLVPRYITWLHQRDAAGATWLDAERTLDAQPPGWGAVQMRGVIDRVDSVSQDGVPTTQLIDYKTGRAQALQDAINRGEDSQLPFYAALMAAQSEAAGDIAAMYLMLDESDKIKSIRHPDVRLSAVALVEGIGHDLSRIASGAALPALGEGTACEFCEARGLCRRDDWPATVEAPA